MLSFKWRDSVDCSDLCRMDAWWWLLWIWSLFQREPMDSHHAVKFLGSHLTAWSWQGCYPVLFLGLHCYSGDADLPVGQVCIWGCKHLKCCHCESDSTVCIAAVELQGLCWCVMILNCASLFVDVPSSFSPFVEFKEKTQQWKLLGNLHFSMISTVVKIICFPQNSSVFLVAQRWSPADPQFQWLGLLYFGWAEMRFTFSTFARHYFQQ